MLFPFWSSKLDWLYREFSKRLSSLTTLDVQTNLINCDAFRNAVETYSPIPQNWTFRSLELRLLFVCLPETECSARVNLKVATYLMVDFPVLPREFQETLSLDEDWYGGVFPGRNESRYVTRSTFLRILDKGSWWFKNSVEIQKRQLSIVNGCLPDSRCIQHLCTIRLKLIRHSKS